MNIKYNSRRVTFSNEKRFDDITNLEPRGWVFGSDVLQRLVSVAVRFRPSRVHVARHPLERIHMRVAADNAFARDLGIHRINLLLWSRLCSAWAAGFASQVIDSAVAHVFQAVAAARVRRLHGLSDGFGGKSWWRVRGCAQPVGLLFVRTVVQERQRSALAVQQAELRVNGGWRRRRTAPPCVVILGWGSLRSPWIISGWIVLRGATESGWLLTELSVQNLVLVVQGSTVKVPAPPRQRWSFLFFTEKARLLKSAWRCWRSNNFSVTYWLE